MTSSRVVGPALAGLLVATVGFGWCFLADGLSYIAVLVALWMMRTEELRPAAPTQRGKGQVRGGLRYARHTSELWIPLVMMAVVGTLSYNFQTVFPLFTTRDLHGTAPRSRSCSRSSASARSSVPSAWRDEGRSASAPSRWRRSGTASRSRDGGRPEPGVAYAFGLLLGVASIAFLTASTAIVQIEAAPEMRGRVLALQAMLFLGSTPIGGPIVGWVSQQFGARYAIGLGAVAALLAGVWGLVRARRLAEKPPIPDEEEAARGVGHRSCVRAHERGTLSR